MTIETSATLLLDALNIPYKTHVYEYNPSVEKLGIAAAAALNHSPDHVLKTLMIKVDQHPACVVLPANKEVDFKRVAQIFGGKKAKMMQREDVQKLTGYQIGGVSPFGQKRSVPTAFEKSIMGGSPLIINGGKQGFLLEINSNDAVIVTNAIQENFIK
ncbi:aminoacyl-tRNA deacylase [Swingsia samuiensis]|uniref:Cys-tRNA(Pro)/Cys-tRNA(Cys) deacylase n=1 Tax=Swingsia samuiensis TaxID=1293412 RepID=A0A4Y6UH48_9PROT|nr:aminoacyl-tRNA deacylase [Swingsia samuiensis]QDH16893.1 aminoacyl-tRNA deacylase [Swingsia samuiensis]